jgi:hypothetical protein
MAFSPRKRRDALTDEEVQAVAPRFNIDENKIWEKELNSNCENKNSGNGNNENYLYPNKYPFVALYRLSPKTEEDYANLANELLEWVERPDIIRFNDFAAYKRMPPSYLWELSKNSKYLADAIEVAKNIIGSRREKGGLFNEMNAGIVLAAAPIYDKSWKKMIEWKHALKNKEQADNQVKVIVIDKISEQPEQAKIEKPKPIDIEDDF